jgi:hypothetical protein
MEKKIYIQPQMKAQEIEGDYLMAPFSMNDEVGGGQLSKENTFEEEEPAVEESAAWGSVWKE